MPYLMVEPQILLLASPVKSHDMGESERTNQSTAVLLVGAAGSNQIFWIFTNP